MIHSAPEEKRMTSIVVESLDSAAIVAAHKQSLGDKGKKLNVAEYWFNDYQIQEPKPAAIPHLWQWPQIEALMYESRDLIPIKTAERRGLFLANPGMGGKPYMTSTLLSDLQLLSPGESAPTHRHTSSSSRLHIKGDGAFTTVEGEKCSMEPGDVVINPSWQWHDHGNDGDGDVIYWNVLDVPLVESMDNIFYDFEYEKARDAAPDVQSIKKPLNYSDNLYCAPGVLPNFVERKGKPYSCKLVYKWSQTRELLNRLRSHKGDPYDALMIEYVNPETGQSVLPTMSFHMQMLRPGEQTLEHRQTSSAVYCVIEGEGYTEVNGKRLEWSKNDFFAIPQWMWHRHVNANKKADAVLFSVTDRATLLKLGLYREQGRNAAGNPVSVAVQP
jgi:gentisate 1,2-dioxygenase